MGKSECPIPTHQLQRELCKACVMALTMGLTPRRCQLKGWKTHKKSCATPAPRGAGSLLQNLEKVGAAYLGGDWEGVRKFGRECEKDLAVHYDAACELKMLRPMGISHRRLGLFADAAVFDQRTAALALAQVFLSLSRALARSLSLSLSLSLYNTHSSTHTLSFTHTHTNRLGPLGV